MYYCFPVTNKLYAVNLSPAVETEIQILLDLLHIHVPPYEHYFLHAVSVVLVPVAGETGILSSLSCFCRPACSNM